jgi:peroxiredoxin
MRTLLSVFLCLLVLFQDAVAQGQPEGIFLSARAPEFKGVDQFGRTVQLREEAKKRPLVLVFYRGYWCPHCMRLLSNLQDSLSFFTQKGISVVAISPESEESIAKTLEKTKAGYSLLRDTGFVISKRYDMVYTLSENQLARYRSGGIDLQKINAPNGPQLVIPGVYIIGKDYSITFRFFDPDHRTRIDVATLLSQL